MNESSAATPIGEVADGYLAMWNETDPTRRREVIEATWTPTRATSIQRSTPRGRMPWTRWWRGCTNSFPGTASVRPGPLMYTMTARWGWELAGPDASSTVVSGVDFAVLAPDGRLREVTGFFEQPNNAD